MSSFISSIDTYQVTCSKSSKQRFWHTLSDKFTLGILLAGDMFICLKGGSMPTESGVIPVGDQKVETPLVWTRTLGERINTTSTAATYVGRSGKSIFFPLWRTDQLLTVTDWTMTVPHILPTSKLWNTPLWERKSVSQTYVIFNMASAKLVKNLSTGKTPQQHWLKETSLDK